jgi:hypothetical protein
MLISDLKELFRKNVPKKDNPKNRSSKKIRFSPEKKLVHFFLNNFFRSILKNYGFLITYIDPFK